MITRTIIALGALAFVGALPASASTPSDRSSDVRSLSASTDASSIVLARHGADDGANHDANDDHGRKRKRGAGHASLDGSMVVARHGADDGANHDANDDHGGKRKRKGHASLPDGTVVARHGADDGAGHVRKRKDGAGHASLPSSIVVARGGADDGANHHRKGHA